MIVVFAKFSVDFLHMCKDCRSMLQTFINIKTLYFCIAKTKTPQLNYRRRRKKIMLPALEKISCEWSFDQYGGVCSL